MGIAGLARPPQELVELRVWVLEDAAQLRTLRAALFEAVTGRVLAAQFTLGGMADRMVLVASELATVALTSGRPPAMVRLYAGESGLVLDVADADALIGPEFAEAWAPDGGRLWLRMARKLSAEVGWYTAGDLKHVWARFDEEQPG